MTQATVSSAATDAYVVAGPGNVYLLVHRDSDYVATILATWKRST